MAFNTAALAAQNNVPAYGLFTQVWLATTNPHTLSSSFGGNKHTLGLKSATLLNDLHAALENEDEEFRDSWHSDPFKMPAEVMKLLPPSVMVYAELDCLFESQMKHKDRLLAQGVDLSWCTVDGLHMVKDMDLETDAGRRVREFVRLKSLEFIERFRSTVVLHRQDAISGLEAMVR